MLASPKMTRRVWLTCGWLMACSSMQNLGDRESSGTTAAKGGVASQGSASRSSGGATATTGSVAPSGARLATEPRGGASSHTAGGDWSTSFGGSNSGIPNGGTVQTAIPTNHSGGTDGSGIDGACWETSGGTTMTLQACPSSYCEIRAQVVGYCGNYVANRLPPIIRYASERSCSGVKDVSIEVAEYGYSCRYERNRLVGILEYSDSYRYCSEQSRSIQSGVPLATCSTARLTFCDARISNVGVAGSAATTHIGAAGAGNSQAMGGTGNSPSMAGAGNYLPMAGGDSKVGGGGTAGALGTGGTQGNSTGGTTQNPVGLCYDAATDTCQPC